MILKVQVVRYVDNGFPGWVESEFIDAEGRRHEFVEKVPIISDEQIGPEDIYPRNGRIRCEILEQWRDAKDRDLVRVNTLVPDAVETTEGASEFVVYPSQVVSAEATIADLEAKAAGFEEKARAQSTRAGLLLRQAEWCRENIAALRHGHWKQSAAQNWGIF